MERNRPSSRRASVVNNNARMSAGEKYHIRLPRTGLQSRTQFITPLFLPSNYEPILDASKKNNFPASNNDPKTVIKIFKDSSRQKVDSLALQDPGHARSNETISKTMIGVGEQSDYKEDKDRYLLFDGDFEGGNLAKVEALELTESTLSTTSMCVEYNIYVHNDPCHPFASNDSVAVASWFFFRIQRTSAGCRYRFHVRNMTLLCEQEPQLRPVSISEIAYQRDPAAGWSSRLFGDDISYSVNASGSPQLCTLSFSLLSEFDNDSVYVALFAPYTYTHLQNVIHTLVHDPQNSSTLTLQTLCHSAAGNRCDLMVITESKDTDAVDSEAFEDKGNEEATVVPKFLRSLIDRTRRDVEIIKSKRAVVVVARQIAGDSASSFACEGLFRFLLGPSAVARRLRKHFVFYVVPMLNPDGVINGLSCSDITGLRLDQQWRRASMQLDPTVYHCKRLLQTLYRRQDIRLRAFLEITCDDSLSIGVNLKSSVTDAREDARIWARRFFVAAAAHSALTKLRRCSIVTVAEDPDSCASVVVEDCDITLSLIVEMSRHRSTSQLMNPLDFSRYGCIVCASLADIFLSDESTFTSVAAVPHYGNLSQSTVAEAVRDCVVSVDEHLLRDAKLFDDTVWDSNMDKLRAIISTVSSYPMDLLLFTLSHNVRFTYSLSSSPLLKARPCSDQSDGDAQDCLDRDLYGEFLLERPPTTKNLKRGKDVSLYYHSTSSKILKQAPSIKGSFLSRQEINATTISLTFQPDSLVEQLEKESNQPAPEVMRTEDAMKDQEPKSDAIPDDLTPDTDAPLNEKTTILSTNPNPTSAVALPSESSSCSDTTPLAVIGLSISEPEKTRLDVAGPVANAAWSTRVGDRGLIKIKFHRPNYNQRGILGKSVGSPRGTVSFYVDKMKLTPLLLAEQDKEQADADKVPSNQNVASEEQEEEIDEAKAMAELNAVLGRHSLAATVGGPIKGFQVVARVPSQKEIPSKRSPRIKTIHGQSSNFLETDIQFEDSIHDDGSNSDQLHPQIEAEQKSSLTGDNNETTKSDSDRAKSPLYSFGGNDFSVQRPYEENDMLYAEKHSQSLSPSKNPVSPLSSSAENQSCPVADHNPSPDRGISTTTPNPAERDAVQSPSVIVGPFPLTHFMDFEPHQTETSKGSGEQSSNPVSPNSEYNRFRELVLEDMGLLSRAGCRKAVSRMDNNVELEKAKYSHRSGPHVKTTLSKTFPVRQQLLVQAPPSRPCQVRPSAPSRSIKVKGYAGIVSEEKLRQRLSPTRLPYHGEDSNPTRLAQQAKSAAYMRAEKALFYLEKDSEASQASISAQQIASFLHQELLLESQEIETHELASENEPSHDAISLGSLSSENDRVSGSELDRDNEAKVGQRKWISFPSVPPDLIRDTTSINDDKIIGTEG